MSLKDVLTEHANVLRSKTGVSNSLSISDMTRLLGDLKWGKENLLKGTSDQYRDLSLQGWGQISTSTNGTNLIDISSYPDGTSFTYSATVSNPANNDIQLEISTHGPKPYNQLLYLDEHSSICTRGQENTILSTTITKKDGISSINTWVIVLKANGNGTPIKIKDERLYEGTEPGIWTPNPSDLMGGGVAPIDLFNPDLTTWIHPNIEIFSENGYQVATLPPDGSQLQTKISWEQNKTYRWTFEAKADHSRDAIHTEMWGGSGARDIELATNWKQYSTSGIPNLAHNIFYFWNSSNHGNVYLRNIRIYEV